MLRNNLSIKPAMVSVLVFLITGSLFAQSYTLKTSTISNGSQKVSGSSYTLTPSIGQPLSGEISSTNYKLTAGFLPTAIPRQAELTLQSSMSITPSEVAPGGTTSLTFDLTNSGAVGVFTSISAEVYLSVNNVFEPEDIRLDTFGVVTDLAAGATLSYPQGSNAKNITIPDTTSVGSYNLFVVLYTSDPIDEINSNNAFSKPLTVSNVVSGDTQAPVVSNLPQTNDVFSAQALAVTVNDASAVTVQLFYRPIAGADFTAATMENTSGQNYSVTLEDAWADELGMEGYISAVDEFGNDTETNLFFLYRENPTETSIPFAGSNFNGKAATYRMFSIPYDLNDNLFANIFNELGEYNQDVWRIFHYTNGNYQELQSGLANSIVLGNGYWFNTTNKDFTIEVGEGTVDNVTQDDPFTKNFQQGWNQIGNPYPFPISWADIQAANPDQGLGSLFMYENGSYQNSGTLAPWEGAFVFCETAGSVSFPLSSKSSSRKAETVKAGFEWKLDLHLTLGNQKHTSSIGMHQLADQSKDRLDEIAVPRFISFLEMTSHHPEYFAPKFIHDYVPLRDHHEWTFDLASDQKSGNALLTWDRRALSAMEGKCFLLNMETLEVIDMNLESSYDFVWKNDLQFRIVYAKDGIFTSALNRVGDPYPNPFRKTISLPVIIQDKHQVLDVSIFNVSGAKILQQSISYPEGGLQKFIWDGKDPNGTEVREGVYFIKLELAGTEKMIRVIKN